MATLEECCERLKDGVFNYNREQVTRAAQEVVALGYDARRAVFDGLLAGMPLVADYYEQCYFVPEVLLCTEALYAGLHVLQPQITEPGPGVTGQVVTGVVLDDEAYRRAADFECTNCSLVPNMEYDAGRNMVRGLFEAAGFRVHDSGRNVRLNEFVQEHLRTDCEILCLPAIMTTGANGLRKAVLQIRARNPRCRIVIGGNPLTDGDPTTWEAAATSQDTYNPLRTAFRMLTTLRDLDDRLQA